MFENFENVFNENAKIKISLLVKKITSFEFDETFGHIIFYADADYLFSNPKNEKFLSAKIESNIKGTISVKVSNG